MCSPSSATSLPCSSPHHGPLRGNFEWIWKSHLLFVVQLSSRCFQQSLENLWLNDRLFFWNHCFLIWFLFNAWLLFLAALKPMTKGSLTCQAPWGFFCGFPGKILYFLLLLYSMCYMYSCFCCVHMFFFNMFLKINENLASATLETRSFCSPTATRITTNYSNSLTFRVR